MKVGLWIIAMLCLGDLFSSCKELTLMITQARMHILMNVRNVNTLESL